MELRRLINNYKKTPPVTSLFSAVLIIFAVIMLWSTIERKNDFINNQQYFGYKASINAREVVINALGTRKRFIQLFVDDNIELIRYLVDEPENEALFQIITQKLSRYIPDLFTINITNDKAELLIDDFDGFTGNVCLLDVLDYANTGHHSVRVHPNHILYHYDVVQRFEKGEKEFIFFASFGLDKIRSALKYASPEGHQLMLIRETPGLLIEITESGGRDTIKNRSDFRLTGQEQKQILSTTKIDGTHWFIVDMIDADVVSAYNNKLIIQNVIIFLLFTCLIIIVRYFIVSNFLKQSLKINDLNENLKELLVLDSLTGLYNKRYLEKQLFKEWSRALRDKQLVTVLLVDIDHFKLYNDNYGHIQGDKCLQQVSQVLRDVFQRENDFVARFGGEEFCVVLNDTSAESPEKLIESVHQALTKQNIEHKYSPTADYITISIGVASLLPDHSLIPENLLDLADKALYEAKKFGRNKTVYSKKGAG